MDPALAGTAWRKSARIAGAPAVPGPVAHPIEAVRTPVANVRTAPPAADVSLELFEEAETFIRKVLRGEYESHAEAERIKENGLALKHMLDGHRKAGSLIPRSAAEAAFFETARDNRDAWMGWVGRIAVTAAAQLDVDARLFTEVLTRHVHQHLTELGEPEFEPGIDGAEG